MQKIWIVQVPENNVLYTKETLLKKLPKVLWEKASRYLDKESSLSFIIGRLLLKKALIKNGLPPSLLEEIRYSQHGKPSILTHNFSISHSNWYVVLVFGTNSPIGIDIEKKKNVNLKLFKYLFTEQEWKHILEAQNSLEKFFWFWVRKEALLKAAGCALKELKLLEVLEHHGMYNGTRYYFKPFDFNLDFNGMVATTEKVDFDVAFIEIADLL